MKGGGRAAVTLLTALVLIVLAPTASAAAWEEILEKQSSQIGMNELEQAGETYLDDAQVDPQLDVDGILKTIFQKGKLAAADVIKGSVRSCVMLLAIALLCGLADSMKLGGSEGFPILPVVAALAVTGVAVSDVSALVGMGRESIDQMGVFSKILLPTAAMATAASGAPAAAAAKHMATILFSDFLITIINQILLPLTYAYMAVLAAWAAVGNEGLKRLGGCLKGMVTMVLSMTVLAFTGYLTVSGVIAGSADAATVKAAKFTVSNMVPVVGSALSDAAETILAGASILRSAVGVFGMLVVLAICLVPFLHLGAHYLAYKITAALTSTVADSRLVGLIEAIGGAFGLVLGMTGACAVVLMVSMISTISMAVG